MGFAFENDSTKVVPGGFEGNPTSDRGTFSFEKKPDPKSPPVLDAIRTNPEENAEINSMSERTGIDPAQVKEQKPNVKVQIRADEIDNATADTPVTRRGS